MEQKISPEEVYRMKVQSDYKAYCYYVHLNGKVEGWIPGKMHKFLCDSVQEFVERETDKPFEVLLISVPPQHGKSLSITETFPSFYLGRNPTHRVIEISYSDEFARRFGKRNLEKIKEHGKIFGIGINPKKSSVKDFELDNGKGSMISRGVGGGVAGNACELMIIDDPIKSYEEADSETYRNKVWSEWEYAYKTRLAAGGKVIVISTRWHEDDLVGRLLEKYETYCEYIRLPCEAEEDDPLGRAAGEALCPEIGKDDNWLVQYKESYQSGIEEGTGIRAWNAQFQCRPTGLEGNLLKREWWQYYDELPKLDILIMSVDAAFKDKDKNDYVAIEVWGKKGADMYLVDLIQDHLDFPNTVRAIRGVKAKYPRISYILIEDKANGPAIISILRSEIPGIIGVIPDGGKEARVNAVSHVIESGNVFLPRNRAFTGLFIDQCASFPNAKHDDMVDAMSQALARLIYTNKRGRLPKKDKNNGWSLPYQRPKGIGKGDQIHVI